MAMGLSLSLNLCPRQAQCLQCTVCRTYMDSQDKSGLTAKIFGATRFSICSGCGTEVDYATMDDLGYRKRWMRKLGLLRNSPKLTVEQRVEAAEYYQKVREEAR